MAPWGHPAPRLAGAMPWIGDDAHAVETLAQAASDAAAAGLELSAVGRAVGWDGEHLPGFGTGGRIDAAAIAHGGARPACRPPIV